MVICFKLHRLSLPAWALHSRFSSTPSFQTDQHEGWLHSPTWSTSVTQPPMYCTLCMLCLRSLCYNEPCTFPVIRLLLLQNHNNCHFLLNCIQLKACNQYFPALSQVLYFYKLVSILGFPSEALPTTELQARPPQLLQARLEEPHRIFLGLLA